MYENEFTEKDWKLFVSKMPKWQEDYMDRLCKEYIVLLQSDKLPSTKFWELEKKIKNDQKSPGVIYNRRRSRMITTILGLLDDNVITIDDLAEFSNTLKDTINTILKLR